MFEKPIGEVGAVDAILFLDAGHRLVHGQNFFLFIIDRLRRPNCKQRFSALSSQVMKIIILEGGEVFAPCI